VKAKKMLAFALVAVLALGTFGLVGCGGQEEPAETPSGEEPADELSGAISVEGSDTMVNIGQAWAEEFMAENPGVMVTIKGGGSGGGIAALMNGTVDFANSSRAIKDEEIEEAKSLGVDPVKHEIAIDAIAVIVNPENPVQELSMEDLGRIYRGEVTNWKDIGGPDQNIVLLSRDTSSGTYEYFKEEVVASEDENAELATSAQLLGSTQAIVEEVTGNEWAIGYVGLGYLTDSVEVVAIDGVLASVDTAKDASYPLSRYLYMYSNGEATGVMAAYLEWILGDAGQAIVVDQGFVPVD